VWWLALVIPASREVENRFEASWGKKVLRLHLNQQAGLGVAPMISATQEPQVGEWRSEAGPRQKWENLSEK
jgi:hypothetical protein